MPLYFQRPENALKRANEFIDVGEKQWALDALYDVIKSRKHRTWQKIHEPIMCKYLELCVELKKSHIAKEGLFQYRNICQQVNIKSLEDVVRGYLRLAAEKTEFARAESQQVVVDIDDLDQVQTPESLLLSAVSSEDNQDRTDRVLLTPWVKFLWESYRQCLELLRNNSRVEALYHDIAQQAFRFCLKYNRKTEFRKLCDNLRTHLGHIHKHQNQQTSVNLNNPDSQAMHLETRLIQLDSAIQMELWQEAYKAIEDIYLLMNLSKKAPNPRLMANYYQKLSLVFWKSNNYLFHAAALFRLFYLSREQKKNITSEEIQKMASKVVLATLAIPMPPNRVEIDRLVETDENVIDKNHRVLSTLLGLPNPPSRASLIKDLTRFGIIHNAPAEIQDLYKWLEIEFHPLKLCDYVQQTFDFLNKWVEFPELCQYIPPLKDITIVRLIKEVSQVYGTVRFSKLLKLIPFVDSFNLEYIVVAVARRNDLQVRIDHQRQCFHFGSELNVSQREEVIEGPHLQSMPSEQMRNHLVFISSVLHKAVNCIQPGVPKTARKELCKEIVRAYNMTSSKEHMRILNRQQIIEERKELLENLNYQKEVEEKKVLEDQQQKLREAEKDRMAREAEERNKQRMLREQNELKRKMVMEKIEQMKKEGLGSRLFDGMDDEDIEKMDLDDLLNKRVEQLYRERKELQSKLCKQERKVDHFERAKRIEEIPLLQVEYEMNEKKDREFWEQHERERIRAIKEERDLAVQYRDRLMRLKDDKDKFLENLKASRTSVYKEKMAEFKQVLEKEKKKRLDERKQIRKEERRAAWVKEEEEKQQRLIDEKRKKEREEELAKLEEIEAKKRAKEREIEERLKQEQENLALELKKKRDEEKNVGGYLKNKDPDKPAPLKSFTNWREREQEKRQSWGPQEKADRIQEKTKEELQDWRKRPDEIKKVEDRIKMDDRLQSDDWRKRDLTARNKVEDKNWSREKLADDKPWRRDEKTNEDRCSGENMPLGERSSRDEKLSERKSWRKDDRFEEKKPVEDKSRMREKLAEDKPWRREEMPIDDRSRRNDYRTSEERSNRLEEKTTEEKPWRKDDKSESKYQYDGKPVEERPWRRENKLGELRQRNDKEPEERSWKRDVTHYDDRTGRHEEKSFQRCNENESSRNWSTLRASDRDREPDTISDWRPTGKNKDERRDLRRFSDKNHFENKDRHASLHSSGKDSEADHFSGSRDQRGKRDDQEKLNKYRSEDSTEHHDRYSSNRSLQGYKDRPPTGRFSSERRDDVWRKREEGPPSGSWRDRGPKDDDRSDKRVPRDTSKRDKEPRIDAEGFVKVRR